MVYIDELLLINFIIDYVLIDFTSVILKLNSTFIRKILSCLIGELSILYLFIDFNSLSLTIYKLIIGIFMILVAFKYNDIKTFANTLIYFYSFAFLLGGILYFFKMENLIKYQFVLLFIPLIMHFYKKLTYNLKILLTTKYKVNIYLKNGKILYLNGYMDTGNNLIDPVTLKKIIIINKDVDENFMLVPYKTIDNESLMKCFKPQKIYIDGIGERNDILVGVINKKFIGYNCLLNNQLLKEKKC
jgi:stage II sporulation protein GA (sporulation sigma-E factor processing peptidase)